MMRKTTVAGFVSVMMAALVSWAATANAADMTLPAPNMKGGKPLMEALKDRQTNRSFSEKKLPAQVLSDLLWSAAGINRPDSGKRTVPSARNLQIVEVYAVLPDGAYSYDAKANVLHGVAAGDLRKLTGRQDFVSSAPLCLVYVADQDKTKGASPDDQALYSGAETGFMVQNAYLYCASAGLNTVVRAMVDKQALAKALNLPEQKKITLVQTVGYPGGSSR